MPKQKRFAVNIYMVSHMAILATLDDALIN